MEDTTKCINTQLPCDAHIYTAALWPGRAHDKTYLYSLRKYTRNSVHAIPIYDSPRIGIYAVGVSLRMMQREAAAHGVHTNFRKEQTHTRTQCVQYGVCNMVFCSAYAEWLDACQFRTKITL